MQHGYRRDEAFTHQREGVRYRVARGRQGIRLISFANDVRAEVVLCRADDDASGFERCEDVQLGDCRTTHLARPNAHLLGEWCSGWDNR